MTTECTCSMTDPKYWTTYGSAVEPGSMWEPDYDCPVHFPAWEPITARRFYCTNCHQFTYWELRNPDSTALEDERCRDCKKGRLD